MSDTKSDVEIIEKSPRPEKAASDEKPPESSKKAEKTESKSSSKRKSSVEDRSSRSSSKRTRKDVAEFRAPSTRRIYVANVPYDAKWQDIKDLFREKIQDCEYVHLFEDDNGKARGCGLVEFKEPGAVKRALEVMDKFEFKGRKLVVKEDYDSQRDHTGRIIKGDLPTSSGRSRSSSHNGYRDGRRNRDSDSFGDSFGPGNQQFGGDGSNRSLMNSVDNSGGNKWGNTYGLCPQFLDSLGINSPLTNRVFVANLDYKVSIRKLREIFKIAGQVQNINLNTDKDGNSKGHGLVIFEHPVEAVQAVSMFHGQLLHDRPMTVKIDRINENEESVTFAPKLPRGLKSIGLGLGAGGMPLSSVAAPPTGNWGGPNTGDMGNNNAGFANRGGNNMGGGFSDRNNFSDMRGGGGGVGMGGGFSDRSGLLGAGGFPDRMTNAGGSTPLDRGNGMGNSFSDRAGILGNYGDRKGTMDGIYDRSGFGGQGYSDRGMSGSAPSTTGFTDRGNTLAGGNYSDRGFASGGGSYADRSGNMRGGNGSYSERTNFPDRGAGLAGNAPTGSNFSGAGLLGAGSDSARFDDYRRDYGRANNYATSTTPIQESDYRSYGGNDDQSLPRYSGPVSSTIIVRNLPVHYSKLDLMDRFLEAGKIEFTKVSGDGLGLVCYSTEREAQRAINIFDGSRLDGRALEVAYR